MTELEKLIADRRALDEKIRLMKQEGIVKTPGAKLDCVRRPSGSTPEWFIAVQTRQTSLDNKFMGWRSVARGCDRNAVIAEIDGIIADLHELQLKINQEATTERGDNGFGSTGR